MLDRSYSVDNVGNISAIADNLDPARGQSFTYDSVYRLTRATGVYGGITYSYDKVGNRLTRTRSGASNDTYTYYPGTNRLHIVQ